MKNRLHDKKAGIFILVSLIIISVAEVIYRAVIANGIAFTTSNFGEQLTVIIFALMILIFSAKGKDRVCYILYGALIAYFVMDQAFELPGMVGDLVMNISAPGVANSIVLRLISMICIIALSALLVEYMNDGTICNKAFNGFSIAAVLMLAISTIIDIYSSIITGDAHIVISALDTISSITMVFLCTFFAYDSAKAQLKKTNLTK